MRSGGSSKSKRSVRMRYPAPSFRGDAQHRTRNLEIPGSRFASPGMTVILRRVRSHPRLDDLVGIAHRLAALDLVDILHARRDLTPDRILAVEERGIVEADEELAVAGIGARRARHRGGAAHMRLLVEFGLELLAGAAGAGALRAAGLRHEAL